MQHTITISRRYTALLLLAALGLAGCGKGNFTSSSSSDWNINGHRTITRTHDGVTRRLESATDVEIQNGHVTKFSKAALVKLEETGGPAPCQAELRENASGLDLWIKENGTFRKGSPKDEAWLERFLKDLVEK